jgi:hypothetical protein
VPVRPTVGFQLSSTPPTPRIETALATTVPMTMLETSPSELSKSVFLPVILKNRSWPVPRVSSFKSRAFSGGVSPFKDYRPHPQIRGLRVSGTSTRFRDRRAERGHELRCGHIFDLSTDACDDELGAIDQIISSAGQIVSVWENTQFFNMLLSNPIYTGDGQPIFSSAHNNLVGGYAIHNNDRGRTRCFQGDADAERILLNLAPSIILTGPEMETAAQQMMKMR